MPVSYTHLDVYKRQLYHCPLSPDDARLIYSHVRRYDGLVNFFSGGIVYNAKQQMAQFERYYPARCV